MHTKTRWNQTLSKTVVASFQKILKYEYMLRNMYTKTQLQTQFLLKYTKIKNQKEEDNNYNTCTYFSPSFSTICDFFHLLKEVEFRGAALLARAYHM